MADKFKACAVPGCNRNAFHSAKGACGFCRNHYIRYRRCGDPIGGNASHGEARRWLETASRIETDECIIWPFGTKRYYPGLKIDGKNKRAHRLMCEIVHGHSPGTGYEAAHSCGRGHEGCVNPRHLRWATAKENSQEMVAHGTSPRGERHGRSKLTIDQVRKIRSLRGTTSQKRIGKLFGISQASVCGIHVGRKWGWLE